MPGADPAIPAAASQRRQNAMSRIAKHHWRRTRTVTKWLVRTTPDRRIGMPTEAIGICEPMLTEHPLGLGWHAGWRAGRWVRSTRSCPAGTTCARWPGGAARGSPSGRGARTSRIGRTRGVRRGRLQLRRAATAGRGRGGCPAARFTLSCLRARRAPFEVFDQAGEHGKPGAFEVFAASLGQF